MPQLDNLLRRFYRLDRMGPATQLARREVETIWHLDGGIDVRFWRDDLRQFLGCALVDFGLSNGRDDRQPIGPVKQSVDVARDFVAVPGKPEDQMRFAGQPGSGHVLIILTAGSVEIRI